MQRKQNRIASWLFLAAIFAIPLVIYAVTTINQPKPTIKWNENLQNALTEAEENNKLILINFTAKWCPACQIMKQEVLPTKPVEKAIKKQYIPVHADIDENNLAANWATNYNIEAIPTFIIINTSGTEIARLEGSAPIQTFVQWLEQYNSE